MSLRGKPRDLAGTCTWVTRVGMQYVADPVNKALTGNKGAAHAWLCDERAREYVRTSGWFMPGWAVVERAR